MPTGTATSPRTERDDAFPNDRARETRTSGDLTATANGTLFKLAGGQCRDHAPARGGVAASRQQPAQRGRLQRHFARPHDRHRRDQPRSADLAPQPRFQRARQSHAQRQCRARSAVGFRLADDDRRGPQFLAGRPAQLHHQLDPRGRRSDHPAIGRPGDRNPELAHLRLHHRPDRAGQRDHRRQSRSCSPTGATWSSSASTGSRPPRPTSGSAPTMSTRRSATRSRTSS